jgi:hypothetical protein
MYDLANKVIPLTFLAFFLSSFDISSGFFVLLLHYPNICFCALLNTEILLSLHIFLFYILLCAIFFSSSAEKTMLACFKPKNENFPSALDDQKGFFFCSISTLFPQKSSRPFFSKLSVEKNLLSLTYTSLMFSLGKKR